MNKVRSYIRSIVIPLVVGGVIGFITMLFMKMSNLNQPFFAPPGILFPIVWTILYTLMGISYAILKTNNLTDSKIDFIYYFQLGVNALWSIFFFVLKWRLFAFLWVILLAVSVIVMIMEFYKKNKFSGLLQIPYFLWILFASYLNIAIYLLNR